MLNHKLKPLHVKRLYTRLHMEPNLITERERRAVKAVYLEGLSSDDLESQFEEPASQIRTTAKRAANKLHVEDMNNRWRDQIRESHVYSMLNDTIEELRKMAREMTEWEERIQLYSHHVDDLCRTLKRAWRHWVDESSEITKELCEPEPEKALEIQLICSPCARELGGHMPEGYVCTWNNALCSVCGKQAAVTSPLDFRLTREGTSLGREPTLEEVD